MKASPKPPRPLTAIALSASMSFCFSGGSHAWGQNEEQVTYWPRNSLVIPFQIDPAGEVPKEVHLEVSVDLGKTWQLYHRADVRTRQFQYHASQDGAILFRLKTVDSQGTVFENPGTPLQVVIDTAKPTGELRVDMDAQGIMQAECQITDAAIDRESLRMEYQTEINHQWTAIPTQLQRGTREGEWIAMGSWELPQGATQLVVRATIRDRAGNAAEWTRVPRLPRTASLSKEMMLASNKDLPDVTQPIGSGIIRLPPFPPPTHRPSTPKPAPQPLSIPHGTSLIDAPRSDATRGDATRGDATRGDVPRVEVLGGPGAMAQQVLSESQQRLIEYQNRLQMQKRIVSEPLAPQATAPQATAVEQTPSIDAAAAVTPPPYDPSRVDREGTLYSNNRLFSLDYAIDHDLGASVARVELWGTVDQGISWEKWGTDEDRQSPFDIEVEQDGLFGFTMVIVGANGVASQRPLPGDGPDAWIRVDTVSPQARIVSALYGKGSEAGSLIIEYQAADEFFGDRPLSLSWSASPQGPWRTFASGARNHGRYVWIPEAGTPPTVYLRLEAVDAAGNVTSHQLDLPVDIQGVSPRGRIQGVRPQG
jgi:hypothetical protein